MKKIKKRELRDRRESDRRDKSLDQKNSVRVVAPNRQPPSSRFRKLLVLCLILLVIGGSALFAQQWFVHQHQARLALASQQAKSEGDWPKLEMTAREWAVWQPDRAEPWLLAADAAKQMGHPERTADYLSNLPDSAPIEAFHDLGRLQMEILNQPLATVETCKRTLRIHPADSESHQRLLYFYAMTCQRDEMVKEARRAIRLGSEQLATYAYLLAAKWLTFTNGYAVNSRWLEAHPDNEMFAVAALIHLIAQREQIAPQPSSTEEGVQVPMERYEQLIKQLAQRYPKNVELIACRCNLFCQSGQVMEVAQALADAPAETQFDSRFWRFKGWYHSTQEQWPEAKAAYEQALQLWPFDWMSQHELAIVLRRSEGLESARAVQSQATLGKELMRAILLAPRLDASSRETFEKISAYMRLRGDDETARSLMRRLEQASK